MDTHTHKMDRGNLFHSMLMPSSHDATILIIMRGEGALQIEAMLRGGIIKRALIRLQVQN